MQFSDCTLFFDFCPRQTHQARACMQLASAFLHLGGAVATDVHDHAITHVVQQHVHQPLRGACAHAKRCSVVWVLACCEANEVLPADHPLYRPFMAKSAPAAGDATVCLTGFVTERRAVVAALLASLGTTVTLRFDPSSPPSLLVVHDVCALSPKIAAAR